MTKSKETLNRFYKRLRLRTFKLRAENKLSLIKLSRKTLIPISKLDLL